MFDEGNWRCLIRMQEKKKPFSGRIFVECTHTQSCEYCTGIQRVVSKIISHKKFCQDSLNVTIIPLIFENGQFYKAGANSRSIFGKIILPVLWCIKQLFGVLKRGIRRFLLLFSSFQWGKIKNQVLAPFLKPYYWLRDKFLPEASFVDGDVLLLLDSSWHIELFDTVKCLRRNNVLIGVVIYDLIPIFHPEFCDDSLVKCFVAWQKKIAQDAAFYISISRTVSDQMLEYVQKNVEPPGTSKAVFDFFHLGSDFCDSEKSLNSFDSMRDSLQLAFSPEGKTKTYLMVGTIEPRKNHAYVVRTFEKMWREGSKSKLCIIGRVGWKCEQVLKSIKKSDFYKSRLFMFNDISDKELSFAYSRAEALLFPSFAEGFGLPIVEALQHRLNVFASDIPIHREIGQNYCNFFSIDDPDSLLEQLLHFERDGAVNVNHEKNSYKHISWQDSSLSLISKVVEISTAL